MYVPDYAATENLRDAKRYSDLSKQAEINEANEARRELETNRITGSIRAAELTPEQVGQILSTLACEMQAKRYTPNAVAAVEMATEELA